MNRVVNANTGAIEYFCPYIFGILFLFISFSVWGMIYRIKMTIAIR